MKKNMGTVDKVIRMLVALVIGGLYFAGQITGVAASVLLALAAVFIATSFVSVCPLYLPFRFSTLKNKSK